jgi:hypothetical protein
MFLADARYEIDFTTLRCHPKQDNLATRTTEVEGGLARWRTATGVDDDIESATSQPQSICSTVWAGHVNDSRSTQRSHRLQALVVDISREDFPRTNAKSG